MPSLKKKKNANKLDTIFFKSTLISSYVKKNRVVLIYKNYKHTKKKQNNGDYY